MKPTARKPHKDYSWWADPANAETVKRISWWDHPENKTFLQVPVSIVEGDGYWVLGSNSDTEKLFGENGVPISVQGDSRQDAIDEFFKLFRYMIEDARMEALNYQRWVPFRRGPWKSIGGKWFVIFGLFFSFRYGKNMKHGWYVPFTKLNISFHNEWKLYNKAKNKQ